MCIYIYIYIYIYTEIHTSVGWFVCHCFAAWSVGVMSNVAFYTCHVWRTLVQIFLFPLLHLPLPIEPPNKKVQNAKQNFSVKKTTTPR